MEAVIDSSRNQLGAIPLTMVTQGAHVRLMAISSGHRLRKRLADLGLTPGTCARVVRYDGHGPLILAVKNDSRLAIGRGMAEKMLVIPACAGEVGFG